jgi:hypothetical protein
MNINILTRNRYGIIRLLQIITRQVISEFSLSIPIPSLLLRTVPDIVSLDELLILVHSA